MGIFVLAKYASALSGILSLFETVESKTIPWVETKVKNTITKLKTKIDKTKAKVDSKTTTTEEE